MYNHPPRRGEWFYNAERMLYAILRNGPVSLLVMSMLFTGILSIATAQTGDTKQAASAGTAAETDIQTNEHARDGTPQSATASTSTENGLTDQ